MSDQANGAFIEQCLNGRALAEDIDDFVERWHAGSGETSLRDYLGMSETEYSLWITDPDILPCVILSRREQRPFAQVVNDHYHLRARSAHADQTQKLRRMKEWLERQGQLT